MDDIDPAYWHRALNRANSDIYRIQEQLLDKRTGVWSRWMLRNNLKAAKRELRQITKHIEEIAVCGC